MPDNRWGMEDVDREQANGISLIGIVVGTDLMVWTACSCALPSYILLQIWYKQMSFHWISQPWIEIASHLDILVQDRLLKHKLVCWSSYKY